MTVRISSQEQVSALLDGVDTVLFDCDGVLWLGNELLPHTQEVLSMLTDMGKKLLFVSNNSTKTAANYTAKIPVATAEDNIITSATATALYLKSVLKLDPAKGKVFVLGGEGLHWALAREGYTTTEEAGRDDVYCVVVGLDPQLTYDKASVAMHYLLNEDIVFVGTNPDSTFPKGGTKYPGAGSVIHFVAFAAGRQPVALCGKPSDAMMEAIEASHHLDLSRCMMVGDRLDTDMTFGKKFGLKTLMVETGIDRIDSDDRVDFIVERLGKLWEFSQ